MTQEDQKNYAHVRMDNAYRCLNAAKLMRDAGDYKSAANRSYYALFHAMRAALVYQGLPEQRKHTGVISSFRIHFIRTGLIDEKYSDTISDAFQVRNDCDYDDFYVISKEDVAQQIDDVEAMLNAIQAFLDN